MKKKTNFFKKIWKDFTKNFTLILLIVSLVLLVDGFYYTFLLGFHGFDNAQNMEFIVSDLQVDLLKEDIKWTPSYLETRLDGSRITFTQAYTDGLFYLIQGIFKLLIACSLIGYCVGRLEK